MKAEMRATNPDRVEFTLSLTASLEEWKMIRNALSNNFSSPAITVRNAIFDMTHIAEDKFERKGE